MQLYPPAAYDPLPIQGGGFVAFMEMFKNLHHRWFKFERRQHYDESGFDGYDAFKIGDYETARRRVSEMVRSQHEIYGYAHAHQIRMTRVRAVELPLSDYIRHYEIHAYQEDMDQGEDIRLFAADDARIFLDSTGVGDYLMFDDQVVTLHYNDHDQLEEARLVTDPETARLYSHITGYLTCLSTSSWKHLCWRI